MPLAVGVIRLVDEASGDTSVGLRFGRDERGDRPHDGTSRLGIEFEGIIC